MAYPVAMKCGKCGTEAVVEVPDSLMSDLEKLIFICGDCGEGENGEKTG